eukprot:2060328-Pyramimonas_sp.AAC.1
MRSRPWGRGQDFRSPRTENIRTSHVWDPVWASVPSGSTGWVGDKTSIFLGRRVLFRPRSLTTGLSRRTDSRNR